MGVDISRSQVKLQREVEYADANGTRIFRPERAGGNLSGLTFSSLLTRAKLQTKTAHA